MIEINLLKQGHGILFRQKYIERNVAYRRAKTLLLLTLLLSSLTVYFTPSKPSSLNKFIMAKFMDHLDIVWFEENLLPFKNKISIQQLKDYASDIAQEIFSKKEDIKKEIYYVRVASTMLSKEVDTIQKDLLAKGFESNRGTYKESVDKFLVLIDLAQTQDNIDNILGKINTPNVNWEIQKLENKSSEIKSPSFFSLEEAEQLKEFIRKKGFKGKVTKISVPVVLYEVRTGNFKNRGQAVRLLNQLQKTGIEGTIIKK